MITYNMFFFLWRNIKNSILLASVAQSDEGVTGDQVTGSIPTGSGNILS